MAKEIKDLAKDFIEDVKLYLNVTDDAIIASVRKHAIRKWLGQIEAKQDKIEQLQKVLKREFENIEEDLVYAKNDYKESFQNINVKLKGRPAIVDYINTEYEGQIAVALKKVNTLESKQELSKEMTEFAIKELETEISKYKNYLKMVKYEI